jgi:hypothetical protein
MLYISSQIERAYRPQQTSSPSPPPRMETGSMVICSVRFINVSLDCIWELGDETYRLLVRDLHLLSLGLGGFLGRHIGLLVDINLKRLGVVIDWNGLDE